MLVSPEQLAMDTLSVYVGGWQGSTPYYFPAGYDARYWKALADANTAIARTERFVMEGKALPQPAVELLTPYPRPLYAELNAPSRPISSLQVVPFAKDGALCVAVGNFWEYGEAFLTAALPGLKPNQRYLVRDAVSGTAFADDAGRNFTGAQLASSGALVLHAGAMRWCFYIVEPTADTAAPKGALKAAEVRALLAKRLPAITKAAAEENAFVNSQAKPAEAPADCSRLKGLRAPGVTITTSVLKGASQPTERVSSYDTIATGSAADRTIITIRCGGSVWELDPDRGAFLRSWRFQGSELCCGNDGMGLGMDGPWVPPTRFNRPFQLTKAEAIPGGVALEFTRTLNVNDGPQYDRAVIVKRIAFTADRVQIDSTIRNPYNDTIRFAYRFQNLPGPMQPTTGTPGTARFTAPDGKQIVVPFATKHVLYKLQQSPVNEDVLQILLGKKQPNIAKLANIVEIGKPEASFVTADGKVALKVTLAPEVDFHGFASFAGGTSLTFEPIFNTCEIPVGRDWHAQMTLEASQLKP
jgi:hypothetical protein